MGRVVAFYTDEKGRRRPVTASRGGRVVPLVRVESKEIRHRGAVNGEVHDEFLRRKAVEYGLMEEGDKLEKHSGSWFRWLARELCEDPEVGPERALKLFSSARKQDKDARDWIIEHYFKKEVASR
jgi:hypothetical protein